MSSIATITERAPRSARAAGTHGAYAAPVHHMPASSGVIAAKSTAGSQRETDASGGQKRAGASVVRVVLPPNHRVKAATMSAAGTAFAVT